MIKNRVNKKQGFIKTDFPFTVVTDEESTIEEQEDMEGETDHKAELVDLAKDGTYFNLSLYYSLFADSG